MSTLSKRPRLLYLMTDQQSATMLGCAGNPFVRTPSMDRLVAIGCRIERAYCTNPVCLPPDPGLPGAAFARGRKGAKLCT
ncbi:MAG: hypothetical protein AMXMBFR7_32520 [Planctomycetota bacterium]